MSLRVLVVAHDAGRSGVPVGVERMVRGLAAEPNVDPTVLFLRGGPLVEVIAEVAPVRALVPGGPPGPAELAQVALAEVHAGVAQAVDVHRRRRAVRAVGPADVVLLAGAAAFAVLPALPREVPVLGHVHELEVGLERALPRSQQHLLGLADRWAVPTDAVARVLAARGMRTDGIVLLREPVPDEPPAPVDSSEVLRVRLGIPTSAPVVGAMGSVAARKGPDLFVRLARLLAADSDIHLVWVGAAGPDAGWLAREVELAGVAGRVHLVPEQERPHDWLRAFDVLVVTSREDAQPLVALEAAQVGTPLVAFAQGGLPDLLDHGRRGLLAPPLAVAALAAAVRDVLDRPEATAARAALAGAHVHAHHRVSVLVPQLRDELAALVARGPEPGRR